MSTTTTQRATLRVDVEDRVATITFTRPEKRNSFTKAVLLDMLEALDQVDADDDVRAVVVTGEGRSFCAGADLEEGFVDAGAAPSEELDRYLQVAGGIAGVPRDGGGLVALRVARMRTPVIAAFNGSAVGIGVTMTLPMDIRIAGEGTRLGFVFARRGLVPEAASSWFLPRIVGISRAVEWVATGRMLTAAEALEGHLVSYVVPDEQVLAKALEIAREIAEGTSALAVAVSRQLLWSMLSAPSPWDAHALDSQAIYRLAAQADVAEGITSFLEKRPARFPLRVSEDYPDYVPPWPARPDHC